MLDACLHAHCMMWTGWARWIRWIGGAGGERVEWDRREDIRWGYRDSKHTPAGGSCPISEPTPWPLTSKLGGALREGSSIFAMKLDTAFGATDGTSLSEIHACAGLTCCLCHLILQDAYLQSAHLQHVDCCKEEGRRSNLRVPLLMTQLKPVGQGGRRFVCIVISCGSLATCSPFSASVIVCCFQTYSDSGSLL